MSRTLVVGDVHACAVELEALVARARPDRLVLVGDLFTKGPDPQGTWRVIREHGAESVLGNHDAFVLWEADEYGRYHVPRDAVEWLRRLPLYLAGEGWLVVHGGLDPEGGVHTTNREQALMLRRWPDESDEANPFWWTLWQGPPLVIYGHDARRGLVDRRPHSLGLDTGCVYGGALTGYLVEEDRLYQEPARRVYKPVG